MTMNTPPSFFSGCIDDCISECANDCVDLGGSSPIVGNHQMLDHQRSLAQPSEYPMPPASAAAYRSLPSIWSQSEDDFGQFVPAPAVVSAAAAAAGTPTPGTPLDPAFGCFDDTLGPSPPLSEAGGGYGPGPDPDPDPNLHRHRHHHHHQASSSTTPTTQYSTATRGSKTSSKTSRSSKSSLSSASSAADGRRVAKRAKRRQRQPQQPQQQPPPQQPQEQQRQSSATMMVPIKVEAGESGDPADADDDSKRFRFLERNRIAASKCRQKKKEWVHDLEEAKTNLETHHAVLQQQYGSLVAEVSQIKTQLMAHAACHDSNINLWIENEARRFVQNGPRRVSCASSSQHDHRDPHDDFDQSQQHQQQHQHHRHACCDGSITGQIGTSPPEGDGGGFPLHHTSPSDAHSDMSPQSASFSFDHMPDSMFDPEMA